jgi:hypothetical protein
MGTVGPCRALSGTSRGNVGDTVEYVGDIGQDSCRGCRALSGTCPLTAVDCRARAQITPPAPAPLPPAISAPPATGRAEKGEDESMDVEGSTPPSTPPPGAEDSRHARREHALLRDASVTLATRERARSGCSGSRATAGPPDACARLPRGVTACRVCGVTSHFVLRDGLCRACWLSERDGAGGKGKGGGRGRGGS